MSSDCYVITLGEIVLLQGLSSEEFNGVLATVEGVSEQRVVVRLIHNNKRILVKSDNLLEAGGVSKEPESEEVDSANVLSDGAHDCSETEIESEAVGLIEKINGPSKKRLDEVDPMRDSHRSAALDNAMNVLSAAREKTTDDLSDITGARQGCESAIQQNPNNWLAYEILGDLLLHSGNDPDAIGAFTSQTEILQSKYSSSRSAALTKLISAALLKIAAAKRRLADLGGELEAFMKISVVDPTNVNVLASIGDLFQDSGNTGEALKYFRQAVIVDPNWALGRFHLARMLAATGESDAAMRELHVAVNDCTSKRVDESTERAAKTFMMIAGMMEQLDDKPSSLKVILKALLVSVNLLTQSEESCVGKEKTENNRLQALAYSKLGQSLERLGKGVLDSGVSLNPTSSGYYDGAISSFKKSCELDQLNPSYKLALGNALRLRAHLKKSKEDLEDSVIVYNSGLLIDPGKQDLSCIVSNNKMN
jgi:tetratricopeptide (TPR) repeat protein